MENFIAYNPTALHFGKQVVSDLGQTVNKYGKKVLLVYGRNSIKQNGIYQQVMAQLDKIRAEVYEYSGIKPNPVFEDVDAAASLGRAKEVDVIVAVGGGSVIDSAKVISVTIPADHSAWLFYSGKAKPHKAIPVITVVTLAASASEMNMFAVMQNNKTKQKNGWGIPLMYPVHSFLDPQYTVTVPETYTAYGIADLVAHSLEAYFGKGHSSLPDRFVFSIIKEAMEVGPLLLNDLQNYEYREKIMYAATMALNGLTLHGRISGDWGVHSIGHVLSVLFDIPHGASLSIAYPAWMKLMLDRIPERLHFLGKNLFGTSNGMDTIAKLEKFFVNVHCPVRLSQVNISPDQYPLIISAMRNNKVNGANLSLEDADYARLLELMSN